MRKFFATIFSSAILIIISSFAYAQSYDLRILAVTNDATTGGNVDVKVQIRATTTSFRMGSGNLVLSYNGAWLANPALLTAHGFSGGSYIQMTVTSPASGRASINIEYDGATGNGTLIGSNFVDVATLRFTISDQNLAGFLNWRSASPNPTNAFADNNTQRLSASSLSSLDLRPPTISSFTPSSGPVGTQVTITGSRFLNTSQVAFNGTPALVYTVDSSTQIRAEVPGGATTGAIRVTAQGGSANSSQSFTVTGANQPPVAVNDAATTTAGQAVVIDVLANDSDPDGSLNASSVQVETAPANGSTSVNASTGAITYTPSAGFTGTDSFTYTVADNQGARSNAATVTVTVNASGSEKLTFTPIADTDVSQAQPSANFGTSSELRFRQRAGMSFIANVKFTVSGVSGSVTRATLRFYVRTGSSTAGTLYRGSNNYVGTNTPWTETGLNWNNTDRNGTPIATTNGGLSANTWVEFDVTSEISGNGTYSFSFVNEPIPQGSFSSREGSNPPQLVVEVQNNPPANQPPVAANDAATTTEGQAVVIDVLANDSDPDGSLNASSVQVETAPANGTTSVNTSTGAITYTPNAGFSGTDSFTYTVADDQGARSNAATVTVTVEPVATNEPPVAADDAATTTEGQAVVIDVMANDSDPDGSLNASSVQVETAPANGSTSVNASTGAITYTPNAGFTGTDSFTYTVADNQGARSNAATVTVTVDPAATNEPPVAADDAATTTEGQAVVIDVLANDSDPDGSLNASSVQVETAPSNGSTSVNTSTGAITYTPNAGFSGTDSFTYTVADNQGARSNAATVTVTVNPGNQTLTFTPVADTDVSQAQPSANFGTSSELRFRQRAGMSFIANVKFTVSGVSGSVTRATLRLYVRTGSSTAGTLYRGSNNYVGTNTPWTETGLNWNNTDRNGTPIATTNGGLSANSWVEFDVTSEIIGDGTYSFAFVNDPIPQGSFSSREGSNPPQLVVETAPSPGGSAPEGSQQTGGMASKAAIIAIPANMMLLPNYPNPFNIETTISYTLPEAMHVTLTIYNETGQTVRQLVDASQKAGLQRAVWDGRNAQGDEVSSGVYFVRLRAGAQVLTQKMNLLK